MDNLDKKLINILQKGLPLEKDPYRAVAKELGISKKEILNRLQLLFEKGYLRRLGGIFDSSKMGYTTLLLAVNVPENIFPEVARYINSFPGVTHNYRRSGKLNMWFTFSFIEPGEKETLVEVLKKQFGIAKVFEFPSLKHYKLRVFFKMEGS